MKTEIKFKDENEFEIMGMQIANYFEKVLGVYTPGELKSHYSIKNENPVEIDIYHKEKTIFIDGKTNHKKSFLEKIAKEPSEVLV